MVGARRKGALALATRIAQKLLAPAEAMLGFQELVVDEVRRAGPEAALDDLERVLTAVRAVISLIQALLRGEIDPAGGKEAQSRLRHDLRTPMNAVLGYSEMVLEDFSDALGPSVRDDLQTVTAQARHLLKQIDTVVVFAEGEPVDEAAPDSDATIAAALERTLDLTSERRAQEPGRILVIDDLQVNREILTRQLRKKGHHVAAVASARDAFEILNKESFDLALVDILMPDMNGIELLSRLKREARWRDMPVIMVSGLSETEAVARCISAGAEDYLPKPVDRVLLFARVDACLERVRWRVREKRYLEQIQFEKDRADALLHAVLPAPVILRLNSGETMIADRFDDVTIVFADIVDFTPLVARTEPSKLLRQLAALFSTFDDLADKHGIEKIKTIGDAYMAAAGVPEPRPDHARAAVAFSRDMIRAMAVGTDGEPALMIRVGVHSGPVIGGLIGRKRFVYDVWGDTVNLASRLESSGQAGKIHISISTLKALGTDYHSLQECIHDLKGIGPTTTYLID